MTIEGEALLGVEGVGAGVVLEDPQVRRPHPDRRMHERRSQAAAALGSGDVETREFQGGCVLCGDGPPADNADHRVVSFRECDLACSGQQPLTPAQLAVGVADSV